MDMMEPGYKMLGSTGTQYLNPDYIQPLHTTLDSKNSPLALLAQTCSSIGKDSSSSSSSKLCLSSLTDKKDQRDGGTARESSSSSAKHRSTADSPLIGSCASGRGGEGTRVSKGGEKTFKDCPSGRSSSSDAGGGVGGGGGGGESSSPKSRVHSSRPLSSLVSLGSGSGKCTPSMSANGGSHHRGSTAGGGSSASASSSTIALPSSSAINNNKMVTSGEPSLAFDGYPDEVLKSSAGLLHQQQQQSLHEALRLQHEGLQQSLQAAAAAGLGPPLPPSTYPPSLLFGHPLAAAAAAAAAALDPLMYSYTAGLAAVHGLAMNKMPPTLSPYMGYARVGTGSGGSTLVPVCKDPYCTTASLHSTHGGLQPPSAAHGGAPCGAGCTQCGSSSGHDKSHRCPGPPAITTLANGGGGLGTDVGQFSSSLYSLSLPPGGLVNPLLGMTGGHMGGVGLAPYACSWLSGGEFCGKRFSKAEDLLQHLRTHASSGDPGLPSFPLPGVPLPMPGFAGATPGHPYSIPGSLSPSSLLQQAAAAAAGQGYPRSLSPTSLLNASRYHPYKSPFAAGVLTPGAASTGSGALAGVGSALDAYYSSPYALFGQRIGAAAVGP